MLKTYTSVKDVRVFSTASCLCKSTVCLLESSSDVRSGLLVHTLRAKVQVVEQTFFELRDRSDDGWCSRLRSGVRWEGDNGDSSDGLGWLLLVHGSCGSGATRGGGSVARLRLGSSLGYRRRRHGG